MPSKVGIWNIQIILRHLGSAKARAGERGAATGGTVNEKMGTVAELMEGENIKKAVRESFILRCFQTVHQLHPCQTSNKISKHIFSLLPLFFLSQRG